MFGVGAMRGARCGETSWGVWAATKRTCPPYICVIYITSLLHDEFAHVTEGNTVRVIN